MKKAIELKLIDIEAKMKKMEETHLYWMSNQWMILHAQRSVLGEILKFAK